MPDNGNRNRTADHSRIVRAAESPVFRLVARVITIIATTFAAAGVGIIGWLGSEVWGDLKSTVDATATDVSQLSDYTVRLSHRFEILGLTVQDHERRIRRAELMPPWRGRDQ